MQLRTAIDETKPTADANPRLRSKPLAYVVLVLFTAMYLVPMTWDLFVWAVYGSAFLRTPKFHHFERIITTGLGSLGVMIGFMVVDRGLELIKQGHIRAFLIAAITVTGANIPVAALLAALAKVIAVKGLVVVTHLHFQGYSLLALVLLACKYRAVIQYFHLMRPDLARLLRPSTERFTVPTAENNH